MKFKALWTEWIIHFQKYIELDVRNSGSDQYCVNNKVSTIDPLYSHGVDKFIL